MRSQKGFTLIEIMIVLAIIAAVMVVAAPKMMRKSVNVKTVARHFIVLSKEVRNKARLTNSTYRIVISMGEKEEQYWVERANGSRPVDPNAYENAKANDSEKDEDAPPPLFQADTSIMRKKETLPEGLRFGSLETTNMKSPLTTGVAYIHFFPEGFVEAAALQLTDGKNLTWTLVFNPLTGQADIVEKAQSLKDLQR